MQDFSNVEKDLWEAADELRANANLASNEYFMPLLGVIFLRHATNRFDAVTAEIAADQAAGRMPKRKIIHADYVRRRALFLPKSARFDNILSLPGDTNWGQAIIDAMEAIEADFTPLAGVLPKDYTRFENEFLEGLLKIFNRDSLQNASGDVFGRIYEYFLMKFAGVKAHDDGEFFTPPSIVQTIVNVIEPEHGKVFDPACGSGGMFVQSSHFMEDHGLDTAKRVVFYGQEKTATTIRIAKMNLAVHGLEGDIREANTFYQDEHTLVGKCDFVMANPPFNVDMVDAKKIKGDPRLPFGLPGVNKAKKVSNANYLWISYFHSYLNDTGRAGFVMSSQASSAGHGEKEVRRKIVETGDVDVMIAIRSNFFYTRSVPCELWFFDRDKPEAMRDKVLMLDARSIFRKVTRKIYDFSPEQQQNIHAIVGLYRGDRDQFIALVNQYLDAVAENGRAWREHADGLDSVLASYRKDIARLPADLPESIATAVEEFTAHDADYRQVRKTFKAALTKHLKSAGAKRTTPKKLQAAVTKAGDLAQLACKLERATHKLVQLAARTNDLFRGEKDISVPFTTENIGTIKRMFTGWAEDRVRLALHQIAYFHHQAHWLIDRFPDAAYRDVEGLVKLVDRAEIEANDWSLTPGRYVGVAPVEEDEDFDFEQAITDIHAELAELNAEAATLARVIQTNLGGLV